MSDQDPEQSDERAAEYALGVLDADERRDVERRMARDRAFAGQVEVWDERLAPLLDAVPPVQPSRFVWMRILDRLGAAHRPARIWDNITLWRFGTGLFAAAAAAAVAVLIIQPGEGVAPAIPAPPTVQPISVGMLRGEESAPASFVVTLDPQNHRLIVAPVVGAAQSGRSYEVWMLPGGSEPVSLGVLDGDRVIVIDAARLLALGPNGTPPALAVSVEPHGGSPTGLPTGPVIASGPLQPL